MCAKQSQCENKLSLQNLAFLHDCVKITILNREILALHNAITYFNMIGAWGMSESLTSILKDLIAIDEISKDQLLNNAWATREAA